MLSLFLALAFWTLLSFFTSFSFGLSITALAMLTLTTLFKGNVLLTTYSYTANLFSLNPLSASLILITLWITLLMFLVSTKYTSFNTAPKSFTPLVMILALTVILFFSTTHLLLFYIFFELSLLPTLLLILKWGYQPERTRAGIYFMMYTICASLPLLVLLLQFFLSTHHLSTFPLTPLPSFPTSPTPFAPYLGLTLAFLVKIPMWGTHLWLPKAHVEAPVSGSMILAGILLKLGGYGLMKIFLLTLALQSTLPFLFSSISLWGAAAIGFLCLRQTDIKSLIAYSSVIHMAIMIAGIFSGSWMGWAGATMMMVAHGLSSPGMFAMANINYEATATRNILLHKGITSLHPISASLWFLLLAANMAAPPSLNLGGELLIYASLLKMTSLLAILAGAITMLAAAYNLYLYSSFQSNAHKLSAPSHPLPSSTYLMGTLHIIPVYALILTLITFSL